MQITMKAARTNANMTLEDAATGLNVSVQTLINWEKGKTEPTISQAKRLSGLYGIGIDNIFFPCESV